MIEAIIKSESLAHLFIDSFSIWRETTDQQEETNVNVHFMWHATKEI